MGVWEMLSLTLTLTLTLEVDGCSEGVIASQILGPSQGGGHSSVQDLTIPFLDALVRGIL